MFKCIFVHILLILIKFISITLEDRAAIDINYVEVEGPGLNPVKIVMPARYFFVYIFGKEHTGTPVSSDVLKVTISGSTHSKRECRVWVDVLNRYDGSFIVRYKLYETCYNLKIGIVVNQEHVNGSPFTFSGAVQPEQCHCPSRNIYNWLTDYGCGKVPHQIKTDLGAFSQIDTDKFYNKAVRRFENSLATSVCNYVVKNNQIYRTCYGEHVGFKMFMDAILLSLSRKFQLPDIEFFSNLGDWPLIKREETEPLPLLSWCGSTDTFDIVMPTYDITEATLENMGRVTLDMLSVQGNTEKSWDSREPKAFWRGRDSNLERLKLIEIARAHPDLFNASLTNFFFFRDKEEAYGPKASLVSFFKFFDYKYQIGMDGTVAAYRFPYLLAGGSLVLKQKSKYYEHFYNELRPWTHYVPVERDLSDIVERVKWAIENDDIAQEIAFTGRDYARSALLPQNVFCYHAHLFNEYSKLLTNKINIREGMEQVKPPDSIQNDCHCVQPKDEL